MYGPVPTIASALLALAAAPLGATAVRASGGQPGLLDSVVYGVMTNGQFSYQEKFAAQLETWAAGLAQQRRFFAVAGRGCADVPGAGLIVEERCPDGISGLACKEGRILEEGFARGAKWLVILGEDNYVNTDRLEEKLRRAPHADEPLVLGWLGCGIDRDYCHEVQVAGGLCGGGGYAVNRAALEALMAKGKEALRREFPVKGLMPGDMATSCALRRRAIRLRELDGLYANEFFKESEMRNVLGSDALTLHYMTPKVMRWAHAVVLNRSAAEVQTLQDAAFQGGCCCAEGLELVRCQYAVQMAAQQREHRAAALRNESWTPEAGSDKAQRVLRSIAATKQRLRSSLRSKT